MPSFIQQDLFDFMAVSIAYFRVDTDIPIDQIAAAIANLYRSSYEDPNLVEDLSLAAHYALGTVHINVSKRVAEIPSWLSKKPFESRALLAELRRFQFCVRYFEPDGSRSSWVNRVGGTWLHKSKYTITDKPKRFLDRLNSYANHISEKAIPPPPTDWEPYRGPVSAFIRRWLMTLRSLHRPKLPVSAYLRALGRSAWIAPFFENGKHIAFGIMLDCDTVTLERHICGTGPLWIVIDAIEDHLQDLSVEMDCEYAGQELNRDAKRILVSVTNDLLFAWRGEEAPSLAQDPLMIPSVNRVRISAHSD